jgi:3-oxoacyl-[acyl-carrier-protein] synthase III
MILSNWDNTSWIQHSYFHSDGSSWDLATVLWWGARYPRDIDKTYFTGDSSKIRDAFMSTWTTEFQSWLDKLGWDKDDIQKIFVHQVAMSNFTHMTNLLEIDASKFQIILPEYWNIASCCIPMSFFQYRKNAWSFKPWDKFVFIGFASGFSYGLVFYEV